VLRSTLIQVSVLNIEKNILDRLLWGDRQTPQWSRIKKSWDTIRQLGWRKRHCYKWCRPYIWMV
jgi:hypothetical protein